MVTNIVSLTNEIRDFARSEGAALVGFGPVERWEKAPEGHRPGDFIPEAKSVIAFGMRLSDAIVDYTDYADHFTGKASWAKEPAPCLNYKKLVKMNIYQYMGHWIHDNLLSYLATKLAWKLEAMGFKSMPMPATTTPYAQLPELTWAQYFFPWSNRHAAVMCGLGEFGYSNIVLTPEYGPRQRWDSVITEAEFEYTPFFSKRLCLRDDCCKCLDVCPTHAIQLKEDIDPSKPFITTPAKTDARLCIVRDEATGAHSIACFSYGSCLRVCPVHLIRESMV